MSENVKKLTIGELVKQASANSNGNSPDLMKTAHEQGINDAQRVVKVAQYTGDIMGTTAFNAFHDCVAASLGFNPEGDAVKTASIADMLDAAVAFSLEKVAESYSPQTGGANLVSTQQAGADQLREQGKANALLAVQAANDAIASVDMGDANTAAQSIATAGQNITLAQQAAQAVADPELQAQVAEASQVVTRAASAMQAQVVAPAAASAMQAQVVAPAAAPVAQ